MSDAPVEQKKNAFDDDDLVQIVEEIEAQDAAEVSLKAKHAGEMSALKTKHKNRSKVLKKQAQENGIPLDVLNATLEERKLDRKTAKLDERRREVREGINEAHVEIFDEASEMLRERLGDLANTPLGAAAIEAADKPVDNPAGEQAEGEKVLGKVGKPKEPHDATGLTDLRGKQVH